MAGSRHPAQPGRRHQEGSVMIMVAVGIVAMLAFAILAIDGSIMMTTKTQLQNAADAAALAGASGLGEGGSQALATERAIHTAAQNDAVQDTRVPVVITESDVTFPTSTRIRVVTHRTTATGDPLRTYFRRVVDLTLPNTVDVTAVAVAEIADICTTDCVKPWAIPDRWDDLNDNGVYDPGEPYDPILTGYVPPGDVGTPIVLKIGNPHASIAPGQFFPVDFPPLGYGENPHTGGDYYREWIATCSPYPVAIGDSLQLEPGNMVGPTDQGVDDLIAMDPTAYWDEERRTIAGSAFGLSPRAIKVPFFDPSRPPDSGRNWVYVTKIAAFFLESRGPGSRVNARFMELASPGTPCPEGAPPSFIHGLTLVE